MKQDESDTINKLIDSSIAFKDTKDELELKGSVLSSAVAQLFRARVVSALDEPFHGYVEAHTAIESGLVSVGIYVTKDFEDAERSIKEIERCASRTLREVSFISISFILINPFSKDKHDSINTDSVVVE